MILSEEYSYDNGNRLTTVTNKIGTQVISQFSYTHDGQGNILSVTSASQATAYQYDDLNRLREISRPNQDNTNYKYDSRGNRKQSSGIDLGITRLTPCQMDYNVWNELLDFTKGSSSYEYAYDADGLRISKSGPSTDIRYYYDDNARIIAESTNSSQLTAQIIWGNKALARKIGAGYYYYLYNGHGDVVQIVNEAGSIVNSYSYDEWGNLTSQTEGITNELKYCGEPFDSETRFYYLRARYYDPTTGRFISQDSNEGDITNPLSLNLYTYCYNNPVMYMDYTGNDPIKTISDFGTNFGKQLNQVNEKYIVPYYDNDGTFRGALKSTGKAVGTGIAVKVAIIIPVVVPAEMEKVATSTTKGAGNYANYAKTATKNASSSEVVLGKFDQDGVSYVKMAEARGSTYFQLDAWDNVAKTVGNNNMWNINEQFLQQQMAQGKSFVLTHNPYQATGYFAQEVDFLTRNGYNFVQNGSIWNAIK